MIWIENSAFFHLFENFYNIPTNSSQSCLKVTSIIRVAQRNPHADILHRTARRPCTCSIPEARSSTLILSWARSSGCYLKPKPQTLKPKTNSLGDKSGWCCCLWTNDDTLRVDRVLSTHGWKKILHFFFHTKLLTSIKLIRFKLQVIPKNIICSTSSKFLESYRNE